MLMSKLKEGNREALQRQEEVIWVLYQLSVCVVCGEQLVLTRAGRSPRPNAGAPAERLWDAVPSLSPCPWSLRERLVWQKAAEVRFTPAFSQCC